MRDGNGYKMECKNCGNPIYEGDRFCSKCGIRVAEEAAAEIKDCAKDEGVLDVYARDADAAEPKYDGVTAEPETGKETAEPGAGKMTAEPETHKVTAEPAGAEDGKAEPVQFETVRQRPLCIPEEKPSKSRHRIKGQCRGRSGAFRSERFGKRVTQIIPGLLVMAAAVLLANSARLVNSYHRNFSTPEEYYRWVEQKAIKRNAKALAEYYANHFVEYLHRYDSHTSGEIRLELGDAGRDMMEQAGLESWLAEGAYTFESTVKDSVMQSIFGLEIGGEKLFGIDAVMDLKDEAVYLGLPGLTETYLALDTGEKVFIDAFENVSGMEPGEYLEYLELLEVLYRESPDRKQAETLADRYLELLLDSVDDVKMRTGKTARAGSIAQTCTTLEIYLDKDNMRNMMTEFLKELQEDSEIEQLLYQIYDLAEELEIDMGTYWDADDLYENFQANIQEYLDNLEYYVTYHNELHMTVYVDDKGQIIGRTMEFPNSWNEVSVSYLKPHHGGRFGYKGSITANGGEVSVTGSGRESGNRVSGNFTVKYEGSGIIDIEVKNFNIKSLKKGYLNGCFTVTVSSGIGRALNLDPAVSRLSDMKLIIDVSMKRSSEKLSMELREGKKLWGTLTIISRSDRGKKISVPSTRSAIFVDDDRDFEEWWDTVDWNELIKKMEKAGLPSDVVDTAGRFGELDADEVMDELTGLMWSVMFGLTD